MSCHNCLRVRSFLGCIPLEKGCIIIGCFCMILSLFNVVRIIQHHVDFELSVIQCRRDDSFYSVPFFIDKKAESTENNISDSPFIMNKSADSDEIDDNGSVLQEPSSTEPSSTNNDCPPDIFLSYVRVRSTIIAVVYLVLFIMTVLMIFGVLKKKPRMMVPWMGWISFEIFLELVTILGFGVGRQRLNFNALFNLLLIIHFTQVLTSYYIELKEAERRELSVTVVAFTRSPNEMMVVLPTGPKDDPPPPYSSFTSVCNPAYNPSGTGFPGSLPLQTVELSPGNTSNNVGQNAQNSTIPIQGNPPSYSDLNVPIDSARSNEASPLMEKPPLPNH